MLPLLRGPDTVSRKSVAGPRRRVAVDLGQSAVEPVAQLVGVVVPLGTALAGNDHAGGRHAREAGDSDELPGHAHGP